MTPSLISSIFPFLKRLNIVVLFVEYDRGIAGGSDQVFTTLQQYLTQVRGCRFTFVRINNKLDGDEIVQSGKIWTMAGDNRYREFSGWQKGIETINRLQLPCDLVLFVNDMFLTPGESFLKDYARRDLFTKSLKRPAIIGRIDTTGQRYTAYNYNVSRWVCTNCFLVPKAAVDAMGNLVSVGENLNDFLTEEFPGTPIFKDDAPINDAYKAWLVEWLTTRWHSRFELNADTWEVFRTKVRNILNEALLTARLAEAGFAPLPYGEKMYY